MWLVVVYLSHKNHKETNKNKNWTFFKVCSKATTKNDTNLVIQRVAITWVLQNYWIIDYHFFLWLDAIFHCDVTFISLKLSKSYS